MLPTTGPAPRRRNLPDFASQMLAGTVRVQPGHHDDGTGGKATEYQYLSAGGSPHALRTQHAIYARKTKLGTREIPRMRSNHRR
ncbi:unnamed protein product [Arctogadus glacialis]